MGRSRPTPATLVLSEGASHRLMIPLVAFTSLLSAGPMSAPCGQEPPGDIPLVGFGEDGVLSSSTYDCTESTDTGYDDGSPFEITVVHIDGKPVEKDTANAFWVMREAAAADGVEIHVVSGFRTMDEQEYLYMCYQCCCCNSCNLAASPGYSNHQSGHALDLNASSSGVHAWLVAHGGEYGFSATVPSENWHWEWWGGGPGGGICDIAAPPAGNVDATACEGIRGWAQDPDAPEAAIDVDIYFDGAAGEAGAVGVRRRADIPRDDLCEPLGSCDHGFELEVPLSLQDGAPHPVHAYGIDDAGADNAELAQSGASVQCERPPLPDGVVRALATDSLAAWHLDPFWQSIRIDATELADYDAGPALGSVPLLVRTASAPEVWLVDAGWRRHVPDPEVAAAWGFDLAAAEIVTDDILAQWREGTPVRARPILVSTDGLTMHLVDDAQHDDGSGDGGGDAGGSAGSGAGDSSGGDAGSEGGDGPGALPGAGDEPVAGGCGCHSEPSTRPIGALALLVLTALRRRRRG